MRLLALLAVRDEIRSIDDVLAHLVEQGAEVCVIDNGSTDGTREVAERWLGHGVVRIDDQPWTGAFELASQLRMKERLAAEEHADWYLHLDADERRFAPRPYATLAEGLADVEARGYNAVDFDEFVFVPTLEEPSFEDRDVLTSMRWCYHYEPSTPDRLRINAWQRQERVDLVTTGGHHVQFPNQLVFPRAFVMRHYPILSARHALEKYGRRVFAPDELANSWHGDRSRFQIDQLRLPRRDELQHVDPDEDPDPAHSWDSHPFLDPAAGPRTPPPTEDPERPARRLALADYARRHRAHVAAIPAVTGEGPRPRWSVMVPVRDPRPEHLVEALRSVLDQDPGEKWLEIVVVDDASTNDVPSIIDALGSDRVSYHRAGERRGLAGNWNDCVARSRGDLVHLLHQDDRVVPGFYDRLGRALATDSALVGGFCRVAGIDGGGAITWHQPPEQVEAGVIPMLVAKEAEMHRMLFPGVVVRRSTYEEIGGFRDDLPYCTDWDFLKRATVLGPWWYEPVTLAHWRQHGAQESARLQTTAADLADRRRSIELTATLLPREIREQTEQRAIGSSVVSALELLREYVETDALGPAVAQAREILRTLEHRQRQDGEPFADTAALPFDASVRDDHDADRRRIAALEAQLKGWVAAVRRARAESTEEPGDTRLSSEHGARRE